jgi:hypothetical protein
MLQRGHGFYFFLSQKLLPLAAILQLIERQDAGLVTTLTPLGLSNEFPVKLAGSETTFVHGKATTGNPKGYFGPC